MRVRLQYILIILLFSLSGALCRQQRPDIVVCSSGTESVHVGCAGCRAFDCTVLVAAEDTSRQAFSRLVTAEFTDGALVPTLDQKAFARTISQLGYSASKYPAAAASTASYLAPPRPGGVEYYIYTLGKIRI